MGEGMTTLIVPISQQTLFCETSEIDGILYLLSEKLDKIVTWDKFRDKFNNYI